MANVTIHEARKFYGAVEALKRISLTINDGEFVVLVGPSGCGKSTLLRMIAGLETISDGDIAIGDKIVNDLLPKDRDIAMVFQNYALYPHMTVAENMGFALKLQNVAKAEIQNKVSRAAAILGLENLLDRQPRQLSGGQRQRVAMGRAIVRDPQVFLFDEPLSNLDANLRVQMRSEIKQLHQRLGTTTVYVTHDQIEAMTMADKIVVMRDGIIEQVGTPLELYDRPANRFVAGFIGSPSMNFIEGQATESGFRTSDGVVLPTGACNPHAVTLGIRPENLAITKEGIEIAVSLLEPTGAETLILGTLGQQAISCIVRERIELQPGACICVTPNLATLVYFDKEGRRLSN